MKLPKPFVQVALGLAVAALLAMSACRTAPVQNITDAPIPSSISMADVEGCIVESGAKRGWIINKQEPGHMVGTLHVRNHTAVVDIYYTTSNYSILYKDSTNLNYDGSKIHSNYNSWVQNLDNDIGACMSGKQTF